MMKLSWLNVFQLCKFLRALGHVMVLAVLSLVGLSYYSVVVVTLGEGMTSGKPHIVLFDLVLAIIFTLVVFMLLWSYLAAVMTEPGFVPEAWHPFADDETAQREMQRWQMLGDGAHDRADPRRPRFCRKCSCWKPERTHHCSVSGRCILKMDHYCLWVVNCVGLLNYKFFLLFLIYTWTACLLSVGILAPDLVEYFEGHKRRSALVCLCIVLDIAFLVTLFGFLMMHMKLLSVNCTSIEMYEKQRIHPWPYDRGWKRNMEDVFGPSPWQWPFPFHAKQERQRLLESVLSPRLITRTTVAEEV